MSAPIKCSEIKWHPPIPIRFGFTGLSSAQAIPIIRQLLDEQWPAIARPSQCAYVVRLRGAVAVAYGDRFSPVIYIGEGNAYYRLYSHARWIAALLVSVPNAAIEVCVAQVRRKNHTTLYRHIEADMIGWFRDEYAALPWFNRQSERSKEGCYAYDPEATKELRRNLLVGSGSRFLWAIRPTQHNEQFHPYSRGTAT